MSGLGGSPLIRRMRESEVREAAAVLYRSATIAYQDINWNHEEPETVNWFASSYEAGEWQDVYVATLGQSISGLMCLKPQFVDQLFIDLPWQGKGLGSKFLDLAKVEFSSGFDLYVFQKNTKAIRFYENHGLVRGKAGMSPDEQEPDFLYHWREAR